MAFGRGPKIVKDNLVLMLDAANPKSYPGTDTTWTDLSGNSHTGTLVNGLTYSSDNAGILNFDGTSDYIDIGYYSELNPAEITHVAWVNASSFVNWHGIISNMPSWGTGFSLQIGTTQNIAAMVSGAYLKTSWTPSTNVWYHIVATHNSSDLNVLYVNGNQESTVTRSISYNGNAITRVGCFYTSPSLFFAGKMSLVRTYNRALTSDEVIQDYNATKSRFGL